jgi:hypothetical protein
MRFAGLQAPTYFIPEAMMHRQSAMLAEPSWVRVESAGDHNDLGQGTRDRHRPHMRCHSGEHPRLSQNVRVGRKCQLFRLRGRDPTGWITIGSGRQFDKR